MIDEHYKCIQDRLSATYSAKNDDYGDSFEKSLNEWGLQAGAIRIGDKYHRLTNLIRRGESEGVTCESLLDTALDLANYATMLAAYIYGKEGDDGCRRG